MTGVANFRCPNVIDIGILFQSLLLLTDVQRRLHVAPAISVASKQSSDARQQVEAPATSFCPKARVLAATFASSKFAETKLLICGGRLAQCYNRQPMPRIAPAADDRPAQTHRRGPGNQHARNLQRWRLCEISSVDLSMTLSRPSASARAARGDQGPAFSS
jgi:hypothetical protein